MGWLVTTAGAALVLVVLRDVFHTLLHPASEGSVSRSVMTAVWRVAHLPGGRNALSLAGPIGFAAVAATWTIGLVLGFALVYWFHLDDAFAVASRLEPEANTGFLDAVYFSGVTGATLGFGDITASTPLWRLLAVLEGISGLAILTAVVSWLLSLYAALERRRSLAGTVAALVEGAPPSETMIESLAADLQSVRTDLMQHRAVYFFHTREPGLELPAVLPALAELAQSAPKGATLAASLDSLARRLGDFVGPEGAGTAERLAAYARDHGVADEAEALRLRVSSG